MVSAGGYAWEITRTIPCCVFTGQAAGTAAALALDQGKKPLRELDIAPLQKALEDTGVTIHMEERFLHGVSEKKFNHAPKESGMSGIKLDTLAY